MTTPSKYETTGGHVTRAGTYLKVLDLLDQLISHARAMAPPDAPKSVLYTKMITTIDALIDQSSVIAHLHNTEPTARDKALNQGWLAISHAFGTIRTFTTTLTQGPVPPRAWLDMSEELQKMKHKIKVLTASKLN